MRITAASVLLFGTALLVGCGERAPEAAPPSPTSAAQFSSTLDIKQLMNWVMDANASTVFSSVGTIVTEKGEEQVAPKTDEQWNAVRNSAAIVLESGNMLMLPGRARDQGEWMVRAKALSTAADEVLKAIDVKDTESLFSAAGDLYQACSDCHAKYIFADAQATDSKTQ